MILLMVMVEMMILIMMVIFNIFLHDLDDIY